jgi:hypothetical protein
MSKEILSANEKQAFVKAYCEQHAEVRLNHWTMENGDSALVFLHESGQLKDVLEEASGPLVQACENASRFDQGFDRLADGTVDTIVERVVREKAIGIHSLDTVGNHRFRPWR